MIATKIQSAVCDVYCCHAVRSSTINITVAEKYKIFSEQVCHVERCSEATNANTKNVYQLTIVFPPKFSTYDTSKKLESLG